MTDSQKSAVIRIAAGVILDADGRMLLVRKRGTTAFMQPGGKIEPDEAAAAALVRELREELGIDIDAEHIRHLGTYCAPAANEPDHTVEAQMFRVLAYGEMTIGHEIEEARWVEPGNPDGLRIAPLTIEVVVPIAAAVRSGEG